MVTPVFGNFFLAPISGWGGMAIELAEALNGQGFLRVQHAGIYLGNNRTIEAMPGGAIIGDITRFPPQSLVWSTDLIDLTLTQRVAIVEAAVGYQGVGYSDLDYLALTAHRFYLPIPHLRKFIADSGHMICSQLVDQVHLDAGVHLFDDNRWPGFVDPGSLFHLLEEKRG